MIIKLTKKEENKSKAKRDSFAYDQKCKTKSKFFHAQFLIMLKVFNQYKKHFTIAILGNGLLFLIVIFHTGLLKQILVYFDSYNLERYLTFQSLLELVFILTILIFYNKIIRKRWILLLSFFLAHFSIIYMVNIGVFYIMDPKGCLRSLYQLYDNNLLIALRVFISISSIYCLIRLGIKIPNGLIKAHYLILIPIIILTLS